MSELTGRNRPMINRGARRGQALIIVLAVMFVLLFIGTIFIATVGRNIQQSGRSVQTQVANTLAEAGLQYCDEQLTHSGDGADWRPTPTPPNSPSDPDFQWLSEGFSRVSMNGGRALVRVVYQEGQGNPDTMTIKDPRNGLLRIEAIGRPGDLGDGTDPTVFVQTGTPPRLRKELIAYKQIGLTDYVRFVTNKNKTNVEAAIGAPDLAIPGVNGGVNSPLSLVIGDPTVSKGGGSALPSGPMRFNSDVRFYGSTYLFESLRGTNDTLLTADTFQTSGNILFDTSASRVLVNQTITGDTPQRNPNDILAVTAPGCALNPSSENPACKFDSQGGLLRTGSNQPDIKGYSQGIPALAPPSLDYYDTGTGFLRYRLLTRETGAFDKDPNGKSFRVGQLGWGTGIYVNNPTDYQAETNTAGIGSSYSLRADWLNPKANFSQGSWQGPYYNPPGLTIELLGDSIRLTRDDNESFYEPDGSPSVEQGGKSITIPLSDYERIGYQLNKTTPVSPKYPLTPFSHDGDEENAFFTANGLNLTNPYKHSDTYGVNVVLMAEGNVKVRGVYGADASAVTEASNPKKDGYKRLERVHLTIVSGRTAYIDGNIVKGDPDKASTCAILAHDYVCVNTTQFMQQRNQANAWTQYPDDLASFSNEIGPGTSTPSLDLQFSWGSDPALYNANGAAVTPKLLVRQASYHGAPTLMNLLINPAYTDPLNSSVTGFYDFTQSPVANPPVGASSDALVSNIYGPNGIQNGSTAFKETYALGYTYGAVSDYASLPKFEARSFPLYLSPPTKTYQLITTPGYENLLRFQVDTTAAGQTGTNSKLAGGSDDYAFGGAIVTPLDIRIEAMLYAQERSFFVIPGYPFNPDRSDTLQAYTHNLVIGGNLTATRPLTYGAVSRVAQDFPFYNEPLDVRITLYGSISENYTASMSDQAAWMARWGYIPVNSGASALSVNPAPNIPDNHLRGTDTAAAGGPDYRTADEQTAKIARGMRYLYDPALAFPYLMASPNGNAAPNVKAPLRFVSQPLYYTINGTKTPINRDFRQILPALPKLPVCPGFLYEGTPDKPL